ncbi:hypothetical protein LSH36_2g14098 [Paralvinella palmiformis]|uniref:Cathepsin propeptide inhibitor domain-containing protein n=1 Tax=Paralvinella palmiformis TaxID=53620 RepID=A0AAD9KFC0_9ANNE|nr:hypothetical protein LSH36_2g14098 [Paralvinella palmiformis]
MCCPIYFRCLTLLFFTVNYLRLCCCFEYEYEFHNFLIRFKKTYKNDTAEYRKRLEVFELNYKISQYQNHNRTDNASAWFGVTKFSDMTFSEFKAVYLSDYVPVGLPHGGDGSGLPVLKQSGVPEHFVDLPKRVDWSGIITDIDCCLLLNTLNKC